MTYEEIKHKLPATFINKPNTLILVDDKGEPWYQSNKDGTFQGFELETLGMRDQRADSILKSLEKSQRVHLWPKKKK